MKTFNSYLAIVEWAREVKPCGAFCFIAIDAQGTWKAMYDSDVDERTPYITMLAGA